MTTQEAPAVVVITPRMEQIIEHMLQKPKDRYYALGICNALDMHTGTVVPLLNKMERAGWLSAEYVSEGSSPRRYYTLTEGTAAMLRRAIAA